MAFILRPEDSKPLTSPLSVAPLDRARDMLLLAQMGDRGAARAWNTFRAEDPRNARLVSKWVEVENRGRAAATAQADAFLAGREMVAKAAPVAKSKKPPFATCLNCGHGMKAKHPACKQCGVPNGAYRGEDVSKRKAKKSYKRSYKGAGSRSEMLTKAAGAPWPITTVDQGVTHMLMALADDPDPGTRLAAQAELRKRRAA